MPRRPAGCAPSCTAGLPAANAVNSAPVRLRSQARACQSARAGGGALADGSRGNISSIILIVMSAAGTSPVGQSVPTNVATPLTRNPVGSPANSSGSLRTSTVALWGPIGFPLRMRPGRRHVAAGSGGTKILSGRPGPGRLGHPRVPAAEQKPSRRRGDQSRHVTTRRKAEARPPASQALHVWRPRRTTPSRGGYALPIR